MVLHCHQPVGNFDHVFKKALEKCYLPVLNLLDAHPNVKVGLHFSGPLLEWMEKNPSESKAIICIEQNNNIFYGGFDYFGFQECMK